MVLREKLCEEEQSACRFSAVGSSGSSFLSGNSWERLQEPGTPCECWGDASPQQLCWTSGGTCGAAPPEGGPALISDPIEPNSWTSEQQILKTMKPEAQKQRSHRKRPRRGSGCGRERESPAVFLMGAGLIHRRESSLGCAGAGPPTQTRRPVGPAAVCGFKS